MENKKIHLSTVSILIKDRADKAPEINEILTRHGDIVLARLGLNLEKDCPENCVAIITLIVRATSQEISGLTKELDQIYGIVAKSTILND